MDVWKWLKPRKKLKDYYKVLGVSPSASQKTIQQAFWGAARTLHPDVNSDPEDAEKFKEVAEAYLELKRPDKRGDYDAKIISDYCQTIVGGSFSRDEGDEERKDTFLDRILKGGL